jgi:hypothetical protein
LADVVGSVLRFVSVVVKGAADLVSEIIGGTLQMGRGIATFSGADFYEGSKRIIEVVVSVVILVVWYLVVRVIIGIVLGWLFGLLQDGWFARPLTDEEEERLRRVYHDSLRYSDIRIHDSYLGGANVTLGNEIWTDSDDLAVLVHEAMHVWQYQNGGSSYLLRNLGDQNENSSGDDGYEWESIYASGTSWLDMGYESQAEFFYDIWHDGTLTPQGGARTSGSGAFFEEDLPLTVGRFLFNSDDWTDVARQAVDHVRSMEPFRFDG